MLRSAAVALLVLASSGEPLQTVRGVAWDEATGSPVPGARVVVLDGADALLAEVRTDRLGQFELDVPGDREVWVHAEKEGFAASEAVPVTLAEGGTRTILLSLRSASPEVAWEARGESRGEALAAPAMVARVVTAHGGRGVTEAVVEIPELGLRRLSGVNGVVVFPELSPGVHRVRVQHLGYATMERDIFVEPGRTYDVRIPLAEEAIELEGFRVRVRSRPWFETLASAYLRMERGLGGFYLVREDLERRGEPPLQHVLNTVPGMTTYRIRDYRLRVDYRDACQGALALVVDGMTIRGVEDGIVPLSVLPHTADIEVLEVHSPTSLPAEEVGVGYQCAILIWTRR